jgi:glycosyltransferase involved in cell wall biosynthesis
MINISIVIPAYNEEKNIGRLLASLQKLPKENILEILVVDNGSRDKTKEIVNAIISSGGEASQKIRLIEEPKKGVAWARSRGAQEARGEIISFLDADSYVTDRWLSKMLDLFSSEKVVCISSPTYYYDLPLYFRIIAHIYWWFATIFVSRIVGYMGNFANLAVRADSYRKIGGIDTSIEFYGDDTDISHRLSKVGKMIFSFNFFTYGSGRRFREQGMLRTTWRYGYTYFSEVLFHKIPAKGCYTEVR